MEPETPANTTANPSQSPLPETIPTSPVAPTDPLPQPAAQPPSQEQAVSVPSSNAPQSVYAGFGRRAAAYFVDGLILAPAYVVIGILLSLAGFGQIEVDPSGFSTNLSGIPSLIPSLIGVAYFTYFTSKSGQTLGKRLLKIKVVQLEGTQQPTLGTILLRESVGRILSSAILLIGYLWVIWDSKKQGWHDKISNTAVVRTT